MACLQPGRASRLLERAEGYLMLGMPERALETLAVASEWGSQRYKADYWNGESLRSLGRLPEAIPFLERASSVRPFDRRIALSLAWCYKRTHRLAEAIELLHRALSRHANCPILIYNLACYWSLAGNARLAISYLATAVRLKPAYRERVADEPDFDPIRNHPHFPLAAGLTRLV